MSNADLERVQSDLAIIKGACVEPAVPREEIRVCLIVAACLLLTAAMVWIVPVEWIRPALLAAVALGAALYFPWKRKILRSDASRRRMENREFMIWGVVLVGALAYFAFIHLAFPPNRFHSPGILFFVGLGCVANGLIHRSRFHYLTSGISLMICACVLPFVHGAAVSVTVITLCGASGAFASAGVLAWLAREERSQHVSH